MSEGADGQSGGLPDEPNASTSTVPNSYANSTGDNVDDEGGPPVLSKKQQKKQARQAHFQATKLERRAKEKAANKAKRAEKRRRVEEEGADPVEIGLIKKPRLSGPRKPFGCNVVIDLSFDDKMVDKEIKSMSTQLGYVYSVNRQSQHPVNVIYTPLVGKLKQRMVDTAQHERWKGVTISEKPLQHLWETQEQETSSDLPTVKKDSVIYLTADSPNTINELEEGKTYIVGGIVDHNRYKNLCFNLANELGVSHAALPIGKYIEMASRKVLTVNQCFEILLKWIEERDWEKAFHAVIPQRKLNQKDKPAEESQGSDPASGGEKTPAPVNGDAPALIGKTDG